MVNKTLAILAGGKSSRMDYHPKALLQFQEKTFIEHIIKAGANFQEIIIVANNQALYKGFNLPIVEDIYKDKGPLSGIHAALHYAQTDYVLCVACDMPLIRCDLLDELGSYEEGYDVVVPEYEGRLQPLCALYSKKILGHLEERLLKNENKLQHMILSLNYKKIEQLEGRSFKAEDFLNINTPTEFEQLCETKG